MCPRYYPIVVGRPILEAVVESLDAAIAAERAGAARLELCVDLASGGTTPPIGLVQAVAERVTVPVFAMARPVALEQVAPLIRAGARGIVAGVLTDDRRVNVPAMRDIVAAADTFPVTFHRAFDETVDLERALEDAITAGVSRILTSGGARTAAEGTPTLAKLARLARGRVVIIAAGGVRAHNVAALIARTGVEEVHARFESESATRQLVDLL